MEEYLNDMQNLSDSLNTSLQISTSPFLGRNPSKCFRDASTPLKKSNVLRQDLEMSPVLREKTCNVKVNLNPLCEYDGLPSCDLHLFERDVSRPMTFQRDEKVYASQGMNTDDMIINNPLVEKGIIHKSYSSSLLPAGFITLNSITEMFHEANTSLKTRRPNTTVYTGNCPA